MNKTEYLERGLERLQTGGWCQRALFSYDGRYCALGAIVCNDNRSTDYSTACYEAVDALRKVVMDAGFNSHISVWNNDPNRTVEDVILAFKQALYDTEN